MNVEQVTLRGRSVRLEPLSMDHVDGLAEVGLDPELWKLQPRSIGSVDDMRAYVGKALEDYQQGFCLPFAVVDVARGSVIGSTRYADIAREHRRLEIGWTWLAPAYQRTMANTESKLLLLSHAFERLGALRVVFKTETLNEKSRRAILRLGAREEGTFRKHLITDSGRPRDMVYFSILDDEWPAVKENLLSKMVAAGTI